MDYYDFVASAIAAVASLYNANAELAHLQKIGVKDVCVLWCGSTLQNNKAWLSTTVPDCMYYEATYDGDKKELRLDAEKEALDPDAGYTEDKGDFEIPTEDEPEETGEEDTEPI